MAQFQHGKSTFISVDGSDISAWTNQSELSRGAGSHNVTAYGADDEAWSGGLLNGKFTCSGIYDKTASTGTHAVMNPLIGQVVAIIRRPEGTGSGLPEQTFDGLMVSYVETAPVADMVSWSAEFTVTGGITESAQV